MSIEKCIHLCNHQHHLYIERLNFPSKVPCVPSQSTPLLQAQPCSTFCSNRLFHVTGIAEYVVFCVRLHLLSIMCLRFICITCFSVLFITEQYSIVWICHTLLIHSLFVFIQGYYEYSCHECIYLDYFQFGAIVNTAAMNICVQVFVWTSYYSWVNT